MSAAREVEAELRRFQRDLFEAGLLLDETPIYTQARGALRVVTWATSPSLLEDEEETSVAYTIPSLGEYCRLVQQRQYSALLSDYAFLQTTYVFRGDRLLRSRLCYYPCPVDANSSELATDVAELGIVDLIEVLGPEQLEENLRMVTPLRFDYDRKAQRPGHAAAHFTVLRPSCRVPVFSPLCVGEFARFIVQHFYVSAWLASDLWRTWPIRRLDRTITVQEELELHMNAFEPRSA